MNEMAINRTRWYGFVRGVAISLTVIDTAIGLAILFRFWNTLHAFSAAWLILSLGAFGGAWTRVFHELPEHRETALRALCYLYMTAGFVLLALGYTLAGR